MIAFRWTGAALACAVMGFPLHGAGDPAFGRGGRPQARAGGGTLGANPLFVFFTVTLPLILPGVIAGAILCFARAMGEFGATITFVSNIPGETQTLPTLIYTFDASPRRRGRRAQADADLGRDLARRRPRFRGVRQARAAAKPRRLSLMQGFLQRVIAGLDPAMQSMTLQLAEP